MKLKKLMGEYRKVTPRVKESSLAFFNDHFMTTNSGAEFFLNAIGLLYKKSLLEAIGIFNDNELKKIVELAKEFSMTYQVAGQQLYAAINNDVEMEKKLQESLIDKCSSLTTFQMVTLEIWANTLYAKSAIPSEIEIERYITTFA